MKVITRRDYRKGTINVMFRINVMMSRRKEIKECNVKENERGVTSKRQWKAKRWSVEGKLMMGENQYVQGGKVEAEVWECGRCRGEVEGRELQVAD